MSNEENPFADPNDVNPFADPSVASHTKPQYSAGGLDEYNPFDGQKATMQNQPPPVIPATIETTRAEPSTYQPPPFQDNAYRAPPSNMSKQQSELDRKAADLEQREQELKRAQLNSGVRENNFPPLPSFFPLKPCFYHDISLEIPMESQKTCKIMFYLWQFYVFTLFFNFITSLAAFCVDSGNGVMFAVALLYLALFPCITYVVWYSRIYKALKNDSSFNYMLFFFVTFFKIIFLVLYALGAFPLGTCGWINAASALDKNKGVAAMMFICAAFWTLLAILNFLMLRRLHQAYRRSGASMEKAQGEFARGVASNKNVQNAAAGAVTAGLSSGGGGGGNTQY